MKSLVEISIWYLSFVVLICLLGGCAKQSPPSQGQGSQPEAARPSETWPQQPIVISCFAAAGGGTDTISRLVAKSMEADLGVKVNVVNRAAGRGGAAINFVWSKARDGYNWGGFSESMLTGSVLGITETTAKDWNFFMVAGAPGVISVESESHLTSLADLINQAGESPQTVKVSASLTGGIWHTKLLALQEAAGVEFQFIPFNKGSQPSQIAALSGEVQAVLTSISEQAELIKAGKLRPLAMVEAVSFDFPGLGTIPAAAELYPDVTKIPVSQFLGFALPQDTPQEVVDAVTAAFERIIDDQAIKDFCDQRLLSVLGYYGAEANQRAQAAESAWVWKLHELGIAVKSPEEFGIPQPEA